MFGTKQSGAYGWLRARVYDVGQAVLWGPFLVRPRAVGDGSAGFGGLERRRLVGGQGLMSGGALCGSGGGPWPPLPPDLEPSGAWPEHPDDRPAPPPPPGLTPCDWEARNLDEDPAFCGLLVGDVITGGELPVCGVCGLEVVVFVKKGGGNDGVE